MGAAEQRTGVMGASGQKVVPGLPRQQEGQWARQTDGLVDPTPYNPLDRLNLARSVELTLLQQRCEALPLDMPFAGAGLYALYYQGDLPTYRPISSRTCKVPIYVGKAVPAGSRKGIVDRSAAVGPVLYKRIMEHCESLMAAKNLEVRDFRARYLVVEDIFIAMGEALLIQQFRPIWNVHVSGFGLHDPGGGRHGSKRSDWDELHPGRPWYSKMKQVKKAQEVRSHIRRTFKTGETATTASLPASAPETAQADVVEARES